MIDPTLLQVNTILQMPQGLFPDRPNSIRQQIRQMKQAEVKSFLEENTLAGRQRLPDKDPVELIEERLAP